MSTIAIITARGGSKRIPRKNIRLFAGRPILAYPIQAALNSRLFDEVMVSTEDDEIAAIARQWGAAVPFRRSRRNADDYAGTAEVLLEVLAEYEARGRWFTYGCCLYPTAPLVTREWLLKGQEMLLQKEYDTVFPVLRYPAPIQRALNLVDGRVRMIWPEHDQTRSQDLPTSYHDAGQFYWFRVAALKQQQRLWTDNSGAIVLSDMEAHDIDTLNDWAVAEFKFQFWRERHQARSEQGRDDGIISYRS